MKANFTEKQAQEELGKSYKKAEELLQDEDKIERFLQRLEKKLKAIPLAGSALANVPIMASLIRNYIKKEYTEVPLGTILAVLSVLIYIVSPVDVIPDVVPGIGYLDDAAVVAACWKLVESDVKEYAEWREKNKKILN